MIDGIVRALSLPPPRDDVRLAYIDKLVADEWDPCGVITEALASAPQPNDAAGVGIEPEKKRARFTNDVSQHGEVLLLLKHIVNASASERVVVDVGARGRERSNSYDLITHFGWRGLLVEANPDLIEPIRADFPSARTSVIHCAVSDYDGEGELFLGVNNDVSSLMRRRSERWGEVKGVRSIPVKRLGGLLESHNVPRRFGLLSIDIEGEDVAVLNDLVASTDYRPDWIIIEVGPGAKDAKMSDWGISDVVGKSYGLQDRIGPNLILRHLEAGER